MALIHCDFFAESLGMSSSMTVILPQQTQRQIGMDGVACKGDFPVLYLLHGLSDDHTIWTRRTSIERYVAPLGLAVVMPNVHRSFYADMVYGGKYWTYVSEELPRVCQAFFPITNKREKTFVAGLSMGGYGAMKLGLGKPECFAAAASLSGALDLRDFFDPENGRNHESTLIFGDWESFQGSDNDVFHLAGSVAKRATAKPKLYACCGTEDFLYEQNVRFRDHARDLGLDLTYQEEPGNHNWGYWDVKIQDVLEWLPL